ncbi:MAG: hypothetical protein JW984_15570 [Deltaproteobacteria bacterium]|uniref:Ceramidase n=1 Tax=Candidatus Zymogenus saltonus TaxID=2844893 RepID=A0A9D8KK84_9DELT|nr:hypothetical protein [Candidatus Zymogenus saltonus]
MEENLLRASAAVVDITPPIGFPLGGYIMRNGVSTGVLDPIQARIGYITDGKSSIVMVGFDWIYILGGWGRSLRKGIGEALGIDSKNVILAATHTHSGPGIFGSFHTVEDGGSGEYLKEVPERLINAAVMLCSASRFVTIKKGKIRIESIGANRNDPDGFFDDTMVGLHFFDEGDDLVMRLLNYGCHPTALGADNLLFSGDFVGYGLDLLDGKWGGASIFMNGAAGDVSTRFTRRGRTSEERKRLGDIFFEAANFMQKTAVPHTGNEIKIRSEAVPVAYRELPAVEQSEAIIDEIKGRLDGGRKAGLSKEEIRKLESLKEGALARLLISKLGGIEAVIGKRKMETEVELLMIGEMGILFIPGEVMSKTAMKLKTLSEFPLMVVGYANDYLGYLVEKDESSEGDYESFVTFLSDGSIKEIINTAEKLIGEQAIERRFD